MLLQRGDKHVESDGVSGTQHFEIVQIFLTRRVRLLSTNMLNRFRFHCDAAWKTRAFEAVTL